MNFLSRFTNVDIFTSLFKSHSLDCIGLLRTLNNCGIYSVNPGRLQINTVLSLLIPIFYILIHYILLPTIESAFDTLKLNFRQIAGNGILKFVCLNGYYFLSKMDFHNNLESRG